MQRIAQMSTYIHPSNNERDVVISLREICWGIKVLLGGGGVLGWPPLTEFISPRRQWTVRTFDPQWTASPHPLQG